MKFRQSLATRLMIKVSLIIISMSLINLLWSIIQYEQQAQAEMKEKAAVIAQQLMATRAFIAEKQDVINYDAEGNFQFKHMNPAAVGKGLGHIFTQYTGYKLKQTRINSRAPENTPDQFEIEQLMKMETDSSINEIWSYDYIDEERVFRYLLPLYYSEECLKCHGEPAGEIDIAGYIKEGSKQGDFAGAISVVFSTKNLEKNIKENISRQLIFVFIVLLLTIAGIYFVMGSIVISPIKELTQKAKELGKGDWEAHINPQSAYNEMRSLGIAFNMMASRLQDSYASLEEKVEERTQMLREANLQMQEQSKELKQMNDRLSETDRLKSEFLAVMSHELKTPLTAIIAFSEILLTEQQDMTDLQDEYLNDIWESAHALHAQIDDILDMSKIESGLAGLDHQIFHIDKVLQGLTLSLRPLFSKKNIRFLVNIHPETSEIEADYDKVKHILQNLLSNAIKFSPENGCITVSVTPFKESDLEGIKINVDDNGIGIKQDDLPTIFDKFWQPEASDGQQSGSGLGLAIVKNFVELHGGWIKVNSEWQKGTTFTFVLPTKPI